MEENTFTSKSLPYPRPQVSLSDNGCSKCCLSCSKITSNKRAKDLENTLKEVYQKTLDSIINNEEPLKALGDIRSIAFDALNGRSDVFDRIYRAKCDLESGNSKLIFITMSKTTLEYIEDECKKNNMWKSEKTENLESYIFGIPIKIFDSLPFKRLVFTRKDGTSEIINIK